VDLGNGVQKQLITGLVGFYTQEQLLNREIIAIVNLKAANLAGMASEVMDLFPLN
jgi:tRNA-binding EMAP/Myf-like protein